MAPQLISHRNSSSLRASSRRAAVSQTISTIAKPVHSLSPLRMLNRHRKTRPIFQNWMFCGF